MSDFVTDKNYGFLYLSKQIESKVLSYHRFTGITLYKAFCSKMLLLCSVKRWTIKACPERRDYYEMIIKPVNEVNFEFFWRFFCFQYRKQDEMKTH